MQDLPIPSWHKFLELVKHQAGKHQAGNSSVFAGHITKCENLLGECTHRRDVLLSETSCIVFFPQFCHHTPQVSSRYHKTKWKYKISCQWAWHGVSPWKQGFPTHASLRSTSGLLIFGMLCYPTANSKRNCHRMYIWENITWSPTYYVTKRPQLLNLATTKLPHLQDHL
jgi:hypothetical protein